MNNKIGLIVAGVVVLGVVGVGLNAVSKKSSQIVGEGLTEKMIEKAAGGNADVDINGQQLTVKTTGGTFSTSTTLPEDFPSDVPIYPKATVTYSGTSAGANGQNGISVSFSSEDDFLKVAEYYTNELKAQGWSQTYTQNTQNTFTMASTKETRNVSVTTTTDNGQTTIILVVTGENQ